MENVYTMADWERDKTLSVKVGQFIDMDVFWELCNCVPPHKWEHGIFQVGEPAGHDWTLGLPTWQTFEYNEEKKLYKYVGNKL